MEFLLKNQTLWPAQQRFLQADPDVTLDVCIYQGGYGSGKTFVGALLGLQLCAQYPGILGLVVAKTFPLVRDTTMQMYFSHLDAAGFLKGTDYFFSKTESKLSFENGSSVLFRHLQTPESIKSLNAGFVQAEEVSQLTEADFFMCLSRLRQVGIAQKRFFGHTNPQARKGWIYETFVEKNPGKKMIAGNKDTGNDVIAYRRIVAPTTDNKSLSPAYLENMRMQYDPQYYRMNVLGEDGDFTAGLVCSSFSDLNVRQTLYKEDLALYLSCDFNVDPMSWALAHRYNNEYHFFDEIVVENTNIDACVREFVRRYPEHHGDIVITGDASGNSRNVQNATVGGTSYTQMLNTFGELHYGAKIRVDVRAQNPSVADRIAAWNAMVCNADGVRRVVIDPQCKWLIWNCRNLLYKEGTGLIDTPTLHQKKERPAKFTQHIFDAASYLIEKYDAVTLKPAAGKRSDIIVPKALKQQFGL